MNALTVIDRALTARCFVAELSSHPTSPRHQEQGTLAAYSSDFRSSKRGAVAAD